MPLNRNAWQEFTWSWACNTGDPAIDQRIGGAAQNTASYALLCAWAYLSDRDAAPELMEHAVRNACGYVVRHPSTSSEKLVQRMKSVIRRRAKQLASRRNREILSGSAEDLQRFLVEVPDVEQRIYAEQLIAQLSPFARSILNRRLLGYTWREIAASLQMDHTAVRRAYFRELEMLVRTIPGFGDL